MKFKTISLALVISSAVFAGCGKKPPIPSTNQPSKVDLVTTASIVDNGDAFQKAISKNGTWIIAILKDLTIDKDLVLDGEFKNSKGELQRKIALYAQDANKNITSRFTLTAPKLTIRSPKASIQHGTFKGDVYVEANDFQLVDNKVDGNVYFLNEAAKASFKMDSTSSVTGVQQIKK
jgi:hypothetical protein